MICNTFHAQLQLCAIHNDTIANKCSKYISLGDKHLIVILADTDILDLLQGGELEIEPVDDIDLQVQPASVDVRLGREFLKFDKRTVTSIDPGSEDDVESYVREETIENGNNFVLHPGDFALGTTVERVAIPPTLVAFVNGRSSIGRIAVIVHATAGLCDPGYEGQITLELANLGEAPVELTPGMRIAQLVFMELRSTADRPYGEDRGSKYQGQQGPTASRIESPNEEFTDSSPETDH